MAGSNPDVKVSLSTFPANRSDALALLYLQNQDLTEKSPEEIARMYNDAYEKICATFKVIRGEKSEERRKSHGYMSLYD